MRPEQLLTRCRRALQMMTDPANSGPATLAFPQDVQAEAFDYPVVLLRTEDLAVPPAGARPARGGGGGGDAARR